MKALRPALADYLRLRRALGYQLVRTEKLLNQFLDYLDAQQATRVTVELALDWAQLPDNSDGSWWAYRLAAVRGFAAFLHTLDPATEIPSTDLLPDRSHRASPYLYSTADVQALLTATGTLSTPLRRATFSTLIALLAVTGMRVGEAMALDRSDIDANNNLLLVRQAKFGKTRELIVHPSTIKGLAEYARLRDQLAPASGSNAVLVSLAGTRLLYCNVHWTWQRLVHTAGLAARSSACRPRIHDLRHSFAVQSMLDAYDAGLDGQHRLTLISTYLGHVHPASTYWYLSASPELMAAAGQRLETYLAGRP